MNTHENSKPARIPITPEKNKEVGLVLTLVFLLCFLRFGSRTFIMLALGAVVVAVLVPALLTPISRAWFWLSEALGTVMSRVILTIVFFGVITPIGLLRRLFSRKRMLMERWKKDKESVFTVREKTFSAADLEHPF
jgi:hypothetical protein